MGQGSRRVNVRVEKNTDGQDGDWTDGERDRTIRGSLAVPSEMAAGRGGDERSIGLSWTES